MGLTLVFSELHVLLSHLWEKEKEKKKGKGKEGKRKEEGIKKERTERRKEFRGKGGKKKKKSLLLALNWSGQFCWSSCL